ncbi:hypothetical protein OsJ_13756 [Oryza sativa Japonica Group]|uniref:Uncharacterized protein n=1 Tax=Oryza sativa subsp. japonica TaxID=39947 RepID=B9FDL3_ORYSJ|nr:hypothetical protein OsJ_13756 [Oryza sativa Japonica Group]
MAAADDDNGDDDNDGADHEKGGCRRRLGKIAKKVHGRESDLALSRLSRDGFGDGDRGWIRSWWWRARTDPVAAAPSDPSRLPPAADLTAVAASAPSPV